MVMLSSNSRRSHRFLFRTNLSFQDSVPPWNLLRKALYWRPFKTPGSPDDHVSAFFKPSSSLYISQGWGSGTTINGVDGPSERHEPLLVSSQWLWNCTWWRPFSLRTSSDPSWVPCQPPGPLGVWASLSQHFLITHYTVLSGTLSKFLPPLLGLWAYSLSQEHVWKE